MKPEVLSDALAELDEELIDEVGQLRAHPKRQRFPVHRVAAAAAVLIVAAGIGVFVVSRLPKALEETPMPTLQAPTKTDEALHETQPTAADDLQTGGLDGGAYAGISVIRLVRVERFTESGFFGTDIETGEQIEVRVNAETSVCRSDTLGNEERISYADLTAGMRVQVFGRELHDETGSMELRSERICIVETDE